MKINLFEWQTVRCALSAILYTIGFKFNNTLTN